MTGQNHSQKRAQQSHRHPHLSNWKRNRRASLLRRRSVLLGVSAVIFGKCTFGLVVVGGIGLYSFSSSSSLLQVQCWRMVGSGVLLTISPHRCLLKFVPSRYWSNSALNGGGNSPVFYITLYAVITAVGLVVGTIRWFILYRGSIHASDVLYKRLLESILLDRKSVV